MGLLMKEDDYFIEPLTGITQMQYAISLRVWSWPGP